MQDMIKEIVDMDRKAREITDAAQLEKVNSEKEVAGLSDPPESWANTQYLKEVQKNARTDLRSLRRGD